MWFALAAICVMAAGWFLGTRQHGGFVHPWAARFPTQHQTAHFVLATNTDVDLVEIGENAEKALQAASTLLRFCDPIPEGQLPLIICRTREDVSWLEELYGLPGVRDQRREHWSPAGGYYGSVPMIAFERTSRSRPTEIACHEVAHYATSLCAPRRPDAIDEGIAMHVEERLLGSDHVEAWRERWARVCARAMGEGTVPGLERLFAMDPFEFRSPKDGLYFSLSWCLVRAIVASDETAPLSQYLQALRTGDPWVEFQRTYSVSRVTELWHAEIQRVAAGSR